jgi:PTS system mannose-specific IIC component
VTGDPTVLLVLVLWGIAAGVDLVSFPQALLGRPIVAASLAGLVAGDLQTGLRIGVLLELFALDVLPIGAARYPDYGPGAVAVAAAAIWSGARDIGPAAVLGLLLAQLAGVGMEWLRRINGRRVRAADAALASGDVRIVQRLQRRGLAGDVARSGLVVILGLVVGPALLRWLAPFGEGLTLVTVAGGTVAGVHGLVLRAGAGKPRLLAGLGLGVGGLLAWLA